MRISSRRGALPVKFPSLEDQTQKRKTSELQHEGATAIQQHIPGRAGAVGQECLVQLVRRWRSAPYPAEPAPRRTEARSAGSVIHQARSQVRPIKPYPMKCPLLRMRWWMRVPAPIADLRQRDARRSSAAAGRCGRRRTQSWTRLQSQTASNTGSQALTQNPVHGVADSIRAFLATGSDSQTGLICGAGKNYASSALMPVRYSTW